MDKIEFKTPKASDFHLAARDAVQPHVAIPSVVSALVLLVAFNLLTAAIAVGTTSYVFALWNRLHRTEPTATKS